LLDIVKALITLLAESINVLNISHFVVLNPVVSEIKLGLVRSGVLAHTIISDDERHESTILTEQA